VTQIEEIAKLSKAMSDTNRVKIVALIVREGSVCVCELCDTLALSQPLVSRHLKQLREAGILDAHKEGKWVVYMLTPHPGKVLEAIFSELRDSAGVLPEIVRCKVR